MNLHGSTAAELREHYLRWRFLPLAAELLRREGVGSVTVAFAQYWNDEAHDAVCCADAFRLCCALSLIAVNSPVEPSTQFEH